MGGKYILSGTLAGRSDSSFRYFLNAEKGEMAAKAELLYAAVNYDDNFKREILQDHYTQVFSCLQRDSETN